MGKHPVVGNAYTLQVLVVILMWIYDVDVAFWEPPMRHNTAVYVVKLVQEHPCLEAIEVLLDLISLMIQIGHFDPKRSFDHSSDPWERGTVFPTILLILKATSML